MNNKNLVETNEYRVLKSCSNCPFLDNGKSIHLREGRVDQIKKDLLEDDWSSFNCHKTVYDLNKDMQSGNTQEPKMCAGAYNYLKSKGRPNMQMRFALLTGKETE